ncbi:uncharacterized protein [Primulina eburnea]|uniref:uncharacterized protein n=1 Tax=Primulina eburnea TaxID=1245227 RepID=UPI003C6C0B16
MVGIQKFGNIKMNAGDTMNEFDENNIVIELQALVKTIVMRESKNLNELELHDRFTDMKVYEFELRTRNEEEPSTSHPKKLLWKYTNSSMDSLGSNTVFRPPVLDGSNYALWKVKMRVYIKSIEERAWQRVLDGWSPPKIVDGDGDSRSKPESSWSNDEVITSNFNSKALNAIFTSVDINMFSLITNCISAKEAWDILQKHCEGSESVRRTKLRMLTSKFESLRMEENETIMEYDRRLREIANEASSLGDSMSNERLVSKVLRSLPERFNIKICAIDESKDTSKLNLEELISSLRTFEMNLDLQTRSKGKAIALQTTDDSVNNLIQEANESNLGEETISLITKKFGDYLKRMRDKKKSVSTLKPSFIPTERNKTFVPTQGNFKSRNETPGRPETKKLDSVQCRECSGFGHYANECANRLRRNKIMTATLSDEDTDEEYGSKEGDDCTSFSVVHHDMYKLQVNPLGVATGVATPGRNTTSRSLCLNIKSLGNLGCADIKEADQEELTVETVQMMYEELYDDWLKRNETNSKLTKENTDLKRNLSRLETLLSRKDVELCKVRDELEKASKTLAKFNASSSKLETMLNMGSGSRSGLGYVESTYEHGESSNTRSKTTVFVKGEDYTDSLSTDMPPKTVPTPKPSAEQKLKSVDSSTSSPKAHSSARASRIKKRASSAKLNKSKCNFICHYCHKPGHIRPFCYKLRIDYLYWHSNEVLHKVFPNTKYNTGIKKPPARKIWVPKTVNLCNVIYTSLKTNISGAWYFDSGCSRHMTGSKEHLIDYLEVASGRVTYGGGAKGKIVGKRTLNIDELRILHNVLHVEGLNSNLISISQLCDDNLHVRFNKDKCEVINNANVCVMTGTRSADNCYLVGEGDECRNAKVSNLDLWHQKLGHVSFKTLKNLSKYEAVRGMPNLSSDNTYVCGSCQKGKQTRVAHPVLQHFGTTRCLEILHMDLMGPIEVESLGGKKYSFVCVDDFSRFTWVSFLREKSETFDVFKKLHAKITNLFDLRVVKIRTDHGKEFENSHFSSLCDKKGITHEFSAPKTPQQNGIAERKNRTLQEMALQEMARVMLSSKSVSKRFWVEALNTACHISNRVFLRRGSTMTSYEILMGRKPNLKYFHIFGCVGYVLNDRDHLAKFDSKSDKCLFLGYSVNSKAYRVYNLRTRTTMESINVVFDDLADLTGK